jgi:hypothetical protein
MRGGTLARAKRDVRAATILRGGCIHLSSTTKWSAAACGLLLAWGLVAAVASLRFELARTEDAGARLDAEFRAFAPYIPPTADVGFLEIRDGSADATRAYYAAQYALVPRVVLSRVGPDYLIVPNGAAQGDADERLAGFHPMRSFPSGHRLFERLP